MARPASETPTAGELEILNVLWDSGPCTVREVMEVLSESRPRAYTSVMTLMNLMTEKKLLVRKPQGRAFLYQAKRPRGKTLGNILGDVLGKAFGGSASSLVTHLLEESKPTPQELKAIRAALKKYEQEEDPK